MSYRAEMGDATPRQPAGRAPLRSRDRSSSPRRLLGGLGCIPPTDPVERARYDRQVAEAARHGATLKGAVPMSLGCGVTPSPMGCPAPKAMGLFPPEGITDWIGIGVIAYLGYKFFWDPHAGESRRARARDVGHRIRRAARRRR